MNQDREKNLEEPIGYGDGVESEAKAHPRDFWTANGSREFGTFPGGVLVAAPKPTPICLQHGNRTHGALHIELDHSHWLKRIQMTVAQAVWVKCHQTGLVYCTEQEDKLKVSITFSPSALLVLRYIEDENPYFRVVTLYYHEGKLDGSPVGRFNGERHEGETPVFELQTRSAPKVIVKKRRHVPSSTG
ncbi:MAG: hypothetical protein ACKVQK_19525 [Burkholderiales bacterium]